LKKPLILAVLLLPVLSFILSACGPQYVGPEPLVEDLLSEAKKTYDDAKYGRALEQLEAIKFDHPGNSYIGEVQFYIGLCHYQLEDFPAAETDFRTVVRDFPASEPYSDNAHYHLCLTLIKESLPPRLDQELTRKAIEETDNFMDVHPQSAFADSVRGLNRLCLEKLAEKEFLAGRLYRRMGYPSSAIHYFKALEQEYPDSRWCVRGRYEWALANYQLKNYENARQNVDTCALRLTMLEEKEQVAIRTVRFRGWFYKSIHLFGLVSYDTRSEMKIFVDDLKRDLTRLNRKIEKKRK